MTDGSAYVIDSLAVALQNAGISVDSTQVLTTRFSPLNPAHRALWSQFGAASAAVKVADVVSPPFAELLQQCMLYSINFYAETFIRLIAALESPSAESHHIPFLHPLPPSASSQHHVQSKRVRRSRLPHSHAAPEPVPTVTSGLAAAHNLLVNELGVPSDSFVQTDGSGLSRRNLISPQAIWGVLFGATTLPPDVYQAFRVSLPVAGVSGTLAKRFIGTPVQGKCSAKTGTMTGVSSLSGYLEHPVFGDVLFAITSNHVSLSTSARQQQIDQIVVLLQNSVNC